MRNSLEQLNITFANDIHSQPQIPSLQVVINTTPPFMPAKQNTTERRKATTTTTVANSTIGLFS